ncbi:unnamed protein product [Durusdinium trenchii]|uniref:Ubiquitin-like domain-containing protein n=1 Tax=Durusdinium trenchii TaxID=1381693 RepID=A0ABP0LA13_9DINO
MSICLHVSLLSGRAVEIWVKPGSSIVEVKRRAQQMLGVSGLCRLLKHDGSKAEGLVCDGLSHGDAWTLQLSSFRVLASTAYAFAGLRGDGSLLLWGVECPSVLGCSWTNRRNPRNDHDHVTRRSTIQSHCRKQRRNHTKTPNTFSTVSRRSHDEHGRPGRRPWGRRVGLQAPRAAMLTPWPPSATIAMASLIANDAF